MKPENVDLHTAGEQLRGRCEPQYRHEEIGIALQMAAEQLRGYGHAKKALWDILKTLTQALPDIPEGGTMGAIYRSALSGLDMRPEEMKAWRRHILGLPPRRRDQ